MFEVEIVDLMLNNAKSSFIWGITINDEQVVRKSWPRNMNLRKSEINVAPAVKIYKMPSDLSFVYFATSSNEIVRDSLDNNSRMEPELPTLKLKIG